MQRKFTTTIKLEQIKIYFRLNRKKYTATTTTKKGIVRVLIIHLFTISIVLRRNFDYKNFLEKKNIFKPHTSFFLEGNKNKLLVFFFISSETFYIFPNKSKLKRETKKLLLSKIFEFFFFLIWFRRMRDFRVGSVKVGETTTRHHQQPH